MSPGVNAGLPPEPLVALDVVPELLAVPVVTPVVVAEEDALVGPLVVEPAPVGLQTHTSYVPSSLHC